MNNRSNMHMEAKRRNTVAPPSLLRIIGKTRIRIKFASHTETIATDIALLLNLFGNISEMIAMPTHPREAANDAI